MRLLKTSNWRLIGFTLIELLVTISIIAILASLLLTAISKSKDKAYQTVCRNNLRQIAIAFQLYQGDSHDQFPTPGSKGVYGPQPEDWIWWQQDRDVNRSTIGQYIVTFNPKLFTCPVDQDALSLQSQGYLTGDPYRYSYSLTSYNLQLKNEGRREDGFYNPGMSTIITKDRVIYPFRSTEIRNPTSKIMLVEESRESINDPRWVALANPLASRHLGRGVVAFADDHVEAVTPKFARNEKNSKPED